MADQSLVLSKTGTMLAIDGHLPYYSDPFNGQRVSVFAFQHQSAQQLSVVDKQLLCELGFRSHLLIVPKAGEANTSGLSDAQRVAESAVAASPTVARIKHDRVLIELCAGSQSRLGQPREQAAGCYMVRITADDDLTSIAGVQKVLDVITEYFDKPILIWVSIPCTGAPLGSALTAERAKMLKAWFNSISACSRHCLTRRCSLPNIAVLISNSLSSGLVIVITGSTVPTSPSLSVSNLRLHVSMVARTGW